MTLGKMWLKSYLDLLREKQEFLKSEIEKIESLLEVEEEMSDPRRALPGEGRGAMPE